MPPLGLGGTYDPDKADHILYSGPELSFGLKPELKIRSDVPAPNAYDSERGVEYLSTAPCITMAAKLKEIEAFNTPSPNAYRPEDC